MKPALLAAIALLAGTPAVAHRLDEYLQGTLLTIEKSRVDAQITLTPGVAIFPALITLIDTDGNGVVTTTEQRAYADRILRDLTLNIDGRPLTPKLQSMDFPPIEDMKEGRGEIHIEVAAELPPGGPNRKLTLENQHQSQFGAYQVNALVPRDPNVRIVAQKRNYTQSFYELDFVQPGTSGKPIALTALLLVGILALRVAATGYKSARTDLSHSTYENAARP
jgi:hypothetical protein